MLLVEGLNNVIRGQTQNQIWEEILIFRAAVLRISGSSFAVATLYFPPSLTALPEDNYTLARDDRTTLIRDLNFRIRELNLRGEQPMDVRRAPTFHTWGLRSIRAPRGPRYVMEALPSHLESEWRERRPADQLHLSDRTRLRIR